MSFDLGKFVLIGNWNNCMMIGNAQDWGEKHDGTHKPRGGELVFKTKQTFTTKVKLILNQSPFTQDPLLKFFL